MWDILCVCVWKPFEMKRTSGSCIEEKKSSVTWHYRNADPDYGSFQAKECQAHLENVLDYNSLAIEVLVGKKNLEVRPTAVNKGEIVKRILAAHPTAEFVFCAGDDKTDEDMFRALTAVNRAGGEGAHLRFASKNVGSTGTMDPHMSPNCPAHPAQHDLASALDAAKSFEPDQNVSEQLNKLRGEEPAESRRGEKGSSAEDNTTTTGGVGVTDASNADLAPHPWEAAMAIGATARGSASHGVVGPSSPLLVPMPLSDAASHPFSLYTVTVGPPTKKTIAHWHVDRPDNVVDVLARFAGLDKA